MKTIKFSIYIGLALLFATSCIKDDSVGEINPISKIELAGEIDTLFLIDRWDTLKISAPELKQSNSEKPLTYSWEINYKEVSNEKNLNYVCEEFGKFPGRLKVSNEDGFFFYYFKVDVRYSYVKGLYILASHNNKTILSYYPEDVAGKEFELDIFEKNNVHFTLGTKPTALNITNTPEREQVYIATGEPSALFRLDGNLMITTDRIETDHEVTFITNSELYALITDINFIMNNRVANLASKSVNITNFTQQSFEGQFEDISLANTTQIWLSPENRRKNGEVYFDNTHSRLIINSVDASIRIQELFKGEFENTTLIDIFPVGNRYEFGAVFKNKTTNEFTHCWFNPGYYNKYSPSKEIKPEIKYKGVMPTTSHISANAIITSAPAKNIMYYSNGNKIFAYNVLSRGNFPTTPLFVCGTDGEIASMLVNKEEDRLYVGVNQKDGSTLAGSLYCFDINNNKPLWKEEKITGKICQIAYKYK